MGVLEDPGPRTVETHGQDDGQKEHLDAGDPDRLEVDEDRDVLEEGFGEPDCQRVAVDGQAGTQGEQERSARARDCETHDPELAPPHRQHNEAYEQGNTQVAGWVGEPRRGAQERPHKIDAEGGDHPSRLNPVRDAAWPREEVPDRIAGDHREAGARRQ